MSANAVVVSCAPEFADVNPCLPISPLKCENMAKPIKVYPPHNPLLPAHKHTIFREIFENQKLFLCQTLAEQCYLLYQKSKECHHLGADWVFSFADIGFFFGLSRQQTRFLFCSWEKALAGSPAHLPGRPTALLPSHHDQIFDYV